MTRGTRIRIGAFLVLSAVGIVYITANYLGFVDRILGRNITISATLPSSGGLFVGSEVDYRGVKIGKVTKMTATRQGLTLTLQLQQGTKLPLDSPMYVHNLSAVGEQYVDFEPPNGKGPYAENGDTIHGSKTSLPVDEGDLLETLNSFVDSVDRPSLKTTVRELGLLFQNTGQPLQRLLDSGTTFIDQASAHTAQTRALLDDAGIVLHTQEGQSENITSFSRDLAKLTQTLKDSDQNLRTTLQVTPQAATEITKLLRRLEPTLPVLLENAISVNQVGLAHLAGLEQLLVIYPRVIAGGFTGTPGDGYGHVNLQLDNSVPPCTSGYLPPSQWRPASDLTDAPIYLQAHCASGPPYDERGTNNVPQGAAAQYGDPGALYRTSYDPTSGKIAGVVDANGNPVRVLEQPNLSVLGDNSWKWLLVGPVANQ